MRYGLYRSTIKLEVNDCVFSCDVYNTVDIDGGALVVRLHSEELNDATGADIPTAYANLRFVNPP